MWKLQRAAAIIMNGFLCQGLGQERDCTIKWGNVFGKGPSSEAAVGAREMQWDSGCTTRTAGAGEGMVPERQRPCRTQAVTFSRGM